MQFGLQVATLFQDAPIDPFARLSYLTHLTLNPVLHAFERGLLSRKEAAIRLYLLHLVLVDCSFPESMITTTLVGFIANWQCPACDWE